jgi:hypothetical protein
MNIEVSNGDILDKLTILNIKSQKIYNPNKIINIIKELEYITIKTKTLLKNKTIIELYKILYVINDEIWNIEDKIRLKEKNQIFDDEFIDLARSVYIKNVQRAFIKKLIKTDFWISTEQII